MMSNAREEAPGVRPSLLELYASESEAPDSTLSGQVDEIVREKIPSDVRADYRCRGRTCKVELSHPNAIQLMKAAREFMSAFPGEMMMREDPQRGVTEIYARAASLRPE